MSEISKEIGQNIRRTRKMRKITHQQLAQAIGKSQSAISKYESGEIAVDIDTLYATHCRCILKPFCIFPILPHPLPL